MAEAKVAASADCLSKTSWLSRLSTPKIKSSNLDSIRASSAIALSLTAPIVPISELVALEIASFSNASADCLSKASWSRFD